MRLTFPHMGTLHIPLRALFRGLGCDVVVPPLTSKRTLEIGVKHCPEFACLPLKISVGNLSEALDLGADTVIMAGGVGPCRFGFYGELQREILRDIGYDFRMVIIDPPQGRVKHILKSLKSLFPAVRLSRALHALRLAWSKIVAIDRLESLANASRALERERGAVSAALDRALGAVDAAETVGSVWEACEAGVTLIDSLVDADKAEYASDSLVRVAVVGEIYVVLEPFANHHVERKLGELGVIVERPSASATG